MVVYRLDHHWRTLLICIQMRGWCSVNPMAQVGIFSKSLYLYLYVFIYVDIKEAYNIWLITHLWLPCLLPKSISGYFSISESISPHPVLFMGLLKKKYLHWHFLSVFVAVLFWNSEADRLVLKSHFYGFFFAFLLVFKRTELPGFIASLYAYGLHKAAMPKLSNLLGWKLALFKWTVVHYFSSAGLHMHKQSLYGVYKYVFVYIAAL